MAMLLKCSSVIECEITTKAELLYKVSQLGSSKANEPASTEEQPSVTARIFVAVILSTNTMSYHYQLQGFSDIFCLLWLKAD